MDLSRKIASRGIGAGVFVFMACCLLAAVAGWIMNLYKIVHEVADPLTGLFIVRCIGVVMAPVGAVLGWF